MIFSVADHIKQIVSGDKTQTRRDSPKYQTGHTYAIQPGRGKPGDKRGCIIITHMWIEKAHNEKGEKNFIHPLDAEVEGGYTSEEYEVLYERLHPLWETRYAYEFKFIPFGSLESKEMG